MMFSENKYVNLAIIFAVAIAVSVILIHRAKVVDSLGTANGNVLKLA